MSSNVKPHEIERVSNHLIAPLRDRRIKVVDVDPKETEVYAASVRQLVADVQCYDTEVIDHAVVRIRRQFKKPFMMTAELLEFLDESEKQLSPSSLGQRFKSPEGIVRAALEGAKVDAEAMKLWRVRAKDVIALIGQVPFDCMISKFKPVKLDQWGLWLEAPTKFTADHTRATKASLLSQAVGVEVRILRPGEQPEDMSWNTPEHREFMRECMSVLKQWLQSGEIVEKTPDDARKLARQRLEARAIPF